MRSYSSSLRRLQSHPCARKQLSLDTGQLTVIILVIFSSDGLLLNFAVLQDGRKLGGRRESSRGSVSRF